ncbi:MAG: RDD family protein [Candidatus Izemoplasmataceae bacterium]
MEYKEKITKQRFIAAIIDVLITATGIFIAVAILSAILGVEISTETPLDLTQTNHVVFTVMRNIIAVTIVILYYGYFPSIRNGQTYGKKTQKIKVVNLQLETPSWYTLSLRNIIWWGSYLYILFIPLMLINVNAYNIIENIASYIIFGVVLVSLISIIVNPSVGGIHDQIFKTIVVHENYPPKSKTNEYIESE